MCVSFCTVFQYFTQKEDFMVLLDSDEVAFYKIYLQVKVRLNDAQAMILQIVKISNSVDVVP